MGEKSRDGEEVLEGVMRYLDQARRQYWRLA